MFSSDELMLEKITDKNDSIENNPKFILFRNLDQ